MLTALVWNAINIWVVDASGGNPVAVTDFESGAISDMEWSHDSSRILFTHGLASHNVVMIRGFERGR